MLAYLLADGQEIAKETSWSRQGARMIIQEIGRQKEKDNLPWFLL